MATINHENDNTEPAVTAASPEQQFSALADPVGKETLLRQLLPIRMISTVVRGYGRGSSDLGIPTANLDRGGVLQTTVDFDQLPTGIYWGFSRIGEHDARDPVGLGNSSTNNTSSPLGFVYKAAISIGYAPTYGNAEKSVELHLIAAESDPRRHASCTGETLLQDFYEQPVRLSVIGYLRPELPFEGLDKLVVAIKNDIAQTIELGDSADAVVRQEKEWVASSEGLSKQFNKD